MPRSGYVYVIEDESERYKLGFSKDAEMRIDDLQTGNAEILTIKYRLEVNDMRRAETAIHQLFAADRIRVKGEWFKVTNRELLEKIFRIRDITEREAQLLKSLGLR